MKKHSLLLLILVLFNTLSANSQKLSLSSIVHYNEHAVVLNALEVDSFVFAIVPVNYPDLGNSCVKIYKADRDLNLVDSFIRVLDFAGAYVTNILHTESGKLYFGLSKEEGTPSLTVYELSTNLVITDSVLVQDSMYQSTTFQFANLIKGSAHRFVLNTVRMRGAYPLNVYNLLSDTLRVIRSVVDTSFINEKETNKAITANMVYLDNQYRILQCSDLSAPGQIRNFNAIKRYSSEFELISSSNLAGQPLVGWGVFHCPLNYKGRWIVANRFETKLGVSLKIVPNFIEIDSLDRIKQLSFYNPEFVFNNGDDYLSNNCSWVNPENAGLNIVYTIGGRFLSNEVVHLQFDSNFNFLSEEHFGYPVNKKDTVFSLVQVNGVLHVQGKMFVYGYLYRSEKGSASDLIRVTHPFIEPLETFEIKTGSDESAFLQNQLKVYPNPFREGFRVEFEGNQGQIRIYTLLGELLKEELVESGQNLNLSSMPTGVYLLYLQTKDGRTSTKKLIKQE